MAGYFEDERHALFVGWVLGLAWKNGVAAEPVTDDDGNYTDVLEIRLAVLADGDEDGPLWAGVRVIVPPPPPNWTPAYPRQPTP